MRGGHAEDFARQVPQRHLDAAGGAQQVVRGAIRARAAERSFVRTPRSRVEGIDLQRIFADQPRLEREDLLLHADAGSAVRLADAVQAVVGDDLDQHVGARRALHRHGLHVADLDALPLRGGEPPVCAQQRNGSGGAQEAPPG